jgi:RNA polymerase sigma-70 factor (ECF subfamily)
MESLRPLLTTYAYNILGSYEDAKDVVQDAFLKFMKIHSDDIEDKKAYLVRSVINLSINLKNRRKKGIDNYPGEWLPEPVATERADTIIIREDVLSYSLMVLLEKLNAKQRAVFILKEAFDYEHEEIAGVLGISVENSRKLLNRAKDQLQSALPETERKVPADYLSKYMEVIRNGDTSGLERLLTDEITVISDGGGKAVAFMKPVSGKQSVSALLMGIFHKFYNKVRIEKANINHQPALFYYENNKLVTCQVFSIEKGNITNIYFIRNPDKLKELQNYS